METKEKTTTLYLIRNSLNNKLYVGISQNIKRRWSQHKRASRNISNKSYAIAFAMHKYGIDNFQFKEIESYDSWAAACTKEIEWIKTLKTCEYQLYNETDGGEGHLGKIGKLNLSDAERKIRSERIRGDKNYFYGKKLLGSDNGHYGHKMLLSVKEKLLEKNRKVSDQQIKEIKELFTLGKSQTEISNQFGISLKMVHCIVRNKQWNNGSTSIPKTKPRLTIEKVKEMRNLYTTGNWTYVQLKEKYDISIGQISRIINGKKWKNI